MNLTYEQWDFIADCYSPILVLASLGLIVRRATPPHRISIKSDIAFLVTGLCLVYGTMGLDRYLGIWPSFSLDYSTHTAFALLFVTYLAHTSQAMLIIAVTSFVLYGLLMLKQAYHTTEDILITIIALYPLLHVARILSYKQPKTHTAGNQGLL